MMAVCGVVTIAAMLAVADDRHAETVAQIGDEAGEGGTRHTQFVQQGLAADGGAPPVQQAVQSVEVVEFAHAARLLLVVTGFVLSKGLSRIVH